METAMSYKTTHSQGASSTVLSTKNFTYLQPLNSINFNATSDYECLATDPTDCQFCPHTQCPHNRKTKSVSTAHLSFKNGYFLTLEEGDTILPVTPEEGDASDQDLNQAWTDFLERVIEHEQTLTTDGEVRHG